MNKVLPLIAVLLLNGWAPSAAQAGRLYKWVDSRGNVSYHDQPPPPDSGYRAEERRYQEGPARDPNKLAAEKNPIVLYSVPACPMCDSARTYLNKNGIPFTEKNVESNADLQKELREKSGGLKVPTILIGATVFDGYVESLLARELATAGYQSGEKNKETAKQEDQPPEDIYKPR